MVDYAIDYRIEANGQDITKLLQENSAQITITDEAGYRSDKVTITLNDTGIALPDSGAVLAVYAGYKNSLRLMGRYVVDEVSLSTPPSVMTISACAAPMDKSSVSTVPLQTQKSRSFPAGTISDLVQTIAKEHGLNPAVAFSLSQIKLQHIDQIDESDMNVLTRVAKEHDAIAKANGGALLFVERGEGKNTKGQQMPTVTLTPPEITSCSVTISQRAAYKKVTATYRDTAAAKDVELFAGAGEPVYRLKGMYSDKKAATTAAQKQLKFFSRGKSTCSVTLPFMPDLVAEARLNLQQFRTGIDGAWSVTRAVHTLNTSGGVTAIEAEVPA